VLVLPLVASLPDHPPEAVQLVAFVDDQLNVAAEPLLTVAGLADRLTVGFDTEAAFTVIAKAGSAAEALPSLTLITMPA
jgi:hypothetical protein